MKKVLSVILFLAISAFGAAYNITLKAYGVCPQSDGWVHYNALYESYGFCTNFEPCPDFCSTYPCYKTGDINNPNSFQLYSKISGNQQYYYYGDGYCLPSCPSGYQYNDQAVCTKVMNFAAEPVLAQDQKSGTFYAIYGDSTQNSLTTTDLNIVVGGFYHLRPDKLTWIKDSTDNGDGTFTYTTEDIPIIGEGDPNIFPGIVIDKFGNNTGTSIQIPTENTSPITGIKSIGYTIKNPLIYSAKAKESGGPKYAIDSYQDGVGVYVVAAKPDYSFDYRIKSKLFLEYGKQAKDNNMTVDNFVIYKSGSQDPQIQNFAQKLKEIILFHLDNELKFMH